MQCLGPDALASETSVISQPSLFESQNGDDSPVGAFRCYADGCSLRSISILGPLYQFRYPMLPPLPSHLALS